MTANGPASFLRPQHLDLLAYLLLNTGKIVTTDQIVDALWQQTAPQTAHRQIQNMLSALRRTLTVPQRTLATLERKPAGYQLRLDDGKLDLELFDTTLAAARSRTQPDGRAALLRQALDLWRGERALAGVHAPFATHWRAHLEEKRGTAWEALFDAELDRANHQGIIPELRAAVAVNPGRECLVAQLMTALYRGGRPADALQVYRQARYRMVQELGLEPGVSLRELQRLILLDDPSLHTRPSVATRSTTVEPSPHHGTSRPTLPVPAQLPPDVRAFAGRRAELASLDGLLRENGESPTAPTIVAITGTAGVGKTALAVRWAHRMCHLFADGQLYVDLRGYDPEQPVSPSDALASFLDALGVRGPEVPAGLDDRAARYRTALAGRRMLVLLDNAATVEQIRPLLPGTPSCVVLVTSRDALAGLVVLLGARRLDLDVLPIADAIALLRRLIGARVDAEAATAELLAEQCARLPIALRVAAELANSHSARKLIDLVGDLTDRLQRLEMLDDCDDPRAAIRAVFSWSYQHLPADAARAFRLISLHPGPSLDVRAAAALAHTDTHHARRALGVLTRAHLVQVDAAGRTGCMTCCARTRMT